MTSEAAGGVPQSAYDLSKSSEDVSARASGGFAGPEGLKQAAASRVDGDRDTCGHRSQRESEGACGGVQQIEKTQIV